jgi:hypothetical protein
LPAFNHPPQAMRLSNLLFKLSAVYLIATFDYGDTIAMKEAYVIDKNHPYDIKLSLIATNIANLLVQNKVSLSNLWKAIYDRIKDS